MEYFSRNLVINILVHTLITKLIVIIRCVRTGKHLNVQDYSPWGPEMGNAVVNMLLISTTRPSLPVVSSFPSLITTYQYSPCILASKLASEAVRFHLTGQIYYWHLDVNTWHLENNRPPFMAIFFFFSL